MLLQNLSPAPAGEKEKADSRWEGEKHRERLMGDPIVGQRYIERGFEFRVDYVEGGEVYVMRWPLAKRTDEMARGCRVTLEVWRKDMAGAKLVCE